MTRIPWQRIYPAALAAAACLLFNACAMRADYRVYDSYFHEYHVWGAPETSLYTEWETQTHRKHRDFRKLRSGEQRDYWRWRHDGEWRQTGQ